MHLPDSGDSQPVESVEDLVRLFRDAGKPEPAWRVGTEHEMIGVNADGGAPPYEGERGIGSLLARIQVKGWDDIREDGRLLALLRGRVQVTIEPGGQLELAGEPLTSAAEMETQLSAYLAEIAGPSRELGLTWLSIGFRPFGRLDDVPWMPKGRYAVMRQYLPTRGKLAHEMMKRTATVQVNLDYGDGDDAAAKLRCAMSVTSLLTALYADSPIVDGADSGYQSYRARIWRDTDPDRCGLLPFAFDTGDVFRAYTEWALDVPMFFAHRGGRYQPAGGMTFRRFLLHGFAGTRATRSDWELHLSTLFPEARLKRYLEIRGCDSGSLPMVLALAPLCRALLYDETARAAATALTAGLSFAQRQELQVQVARLGLRAPVGDTGHSAGALARELVAIAADALRRLEPGDLRFLAPLQQIVDQQRTQADDVAALWQETGGDPIKVIPRLAHPVL